MKKLRVGVIGCGGRGAGHALGYSLVDPEKVELVACADSHLKAAELLCGRFGFARAYSDYHEMLEKENLDVVSMCLWPKLHCPAVLDCLNAPKKPLLINAEKPMAPTMGEAIHMHEACKEAGVMLTFSHQRRFSSVFSLGRTLIDEGVIGDLQRMEMDCSNLFDWGTHWFDMMQFYNHDLEPDWLMGQIDIADDALIFGARIETAGIAYIKWPNNVTGLLTTGAGTASSAPIRVIGSKGMLDIGHGKAKLFTAEKEWEDVEPRFANIKGGDTSFHIIDSIDCVLEGRTSTLCSENALRATQLIFATYESSRSRKRVLLPFRGEDSALLTMLETGEKSIPNWPAFLTEEEEQDGCQLLFNGENLDGWEQMGNAWAVHHGIICGEERENCCLCYNQDLQDFSLTFEMRLDSRTEAGITLRADENGKGITIPLVEDRTDPVDEKSIGGIRGIVSPAIHARVGSSRWFWFEVRCEGDTVSVFFAETEVMSVKLSDYPELAELPKSGGLRLQIESGWLHLRNVILQEL